MKKEEQDSRQQISIKQIQHEGNRAQSQQALNHYSESLEYQEQLEYINEIEEIKFVKQKQSLTNLSNLFTCIFQFLTKLQCTSKSNKPVCLSQMGRNDLIYHIQNRIENQLKMLIIDKNKNQSLTSFQIFHHNQSGLKIYLLTYKGIRYGIKLDLQTLQQFKIEFMLYPYKSIICQNQLGEYNLPLSRRQRVKSRQIYEKNMIRLSQKSFNISKQFFIKMFYVNFLALGLKLSPLLWIIYICSIAPTIGFHQNFKGQQQLVMEQDWDKNIIQIVQNSGYLNDKLQQSKRVDKHCFIQSFNGYLVPGDILILKSGQLVPCDAILIKGKIWVNEVSLTGENTPIQKNQFNHQVSNLHSNNWLYSNSPILKVQKDQEGNQIAKAHVIHTGFRTKSGRQIRKILFNQHQNPSYHKSLVYFFLQIFVISLIFGGGSIIYFTNQKNYFCISKMVSQIVFSSNPLFASTFIFYAIFFNIKKYVSLNINGFFMNKMSTPTTIKTIFFDKTGTLTENKLKIAQIYKIQADNPDLISIKQQFFNHDNLFIQKIFASCHSVQQIKNEQGFTLVGNQIDKQMLKFSECIISEPRLQKMNQILQNKKQIHGYCNIKRDLNQHTRSEKINLQIIANLQFKSENKCMYSLVYDKIKKQAFIFCKGSPDHLYSYTKAQNRSSFINSVNLLGFRVIAFGYKKIQLDEISDYSKKHKDIGQILNNIIIIGFVLFENKLKSQVPSFIQIIQNQENIDTRMITGDNIYNAVQTSRESGIVKKTSSIILLEGAQIIENNQIFVKRLNFAKGTVEDAVQINLNDLKNSEEYAFAIDNAFLNYYLKLIQQNQLINQNKMQKDTALQFWNQLFYNKIRIFAQIEAKNKTKIIELYKRMRDQQIKSKRIYFNPDQVITTMMVGDGLNDLPAIHQADIGVGLNTKDLRYGTVFSINNLEQILFIIRSGNNLAKKIINAVQFLGIMSQMSMWACIYLISRASIQFQPQFIWRNFILIILQLIILFFVEPSSQRRRYQFSYNFMYKQNHLIYWGSCIIIAITIFAATFYYNSLENVIQISDIQISDQWYLKVSCQYNVTNISTIISLMMSFWQISLYIIINREFFGKNNLIFSFTAIAFHLLSIISFFITDNLGWFGFIKISNQEARIILAINSAGVIVCWIYHLLIEHFFFRCRQIKD